MDRVVAAADFLAELRRTKGTAVALPESCRPGTAAEAYAVQAALVERLLAPVDGRAAGYKVACTNRLAQDLLGVDGPFCGRLLSPTVHAAPARLPAGNFVHRVLEAEFGFEVAETVPVSAEPYTADSIAPFLGAVLPAIEIVEWHYEDWTTAGCAVADCRQRHPRRLGCRGALCGMAGSGSDHARGTAHRQRPGHHAGQRRRGAGTSAQRHGLAGQRVARIRRRPARR